MSRKRGQEKEVILTISDFIVEELFFIGFKRSKVPKKKKCKFICTRETHQSKASNHACLWLFINSAFPKNKD